VVNRYTVPRLAETEILQAVSTGKEVVAHTDPVSVPGYTGAGYIILDPVTGEGAYRISGGKNGGAGKMAAQSISKVFEFRLLMSAVVDSALGGTGQSSYGGPVLGALLTVLSTFVTIIDIFESCNDPFVLFALTIFVLSITTAVAIFFSQLGALAPSVAALSPVSIIGLATIFSIGISKSVEKLRGVGGC